MSENTETNKTVLPPPKSQQELFTELRALQHIADLSQQAVENHMNQIAEDPLGPYGKVLLNAPHFLPPVASKDSLHPKRKCAGSNNTRKKQKHVTPYDTKSGDLISLLEQTDENGLNLREIEEEEKIQEARFRLWKNTNEETQFKVTSIAE